MSERNKRKKTGKSSEKGKGNQKTKKRKSTQPRKAKSTKSSSTQIAKEEESEDRKDEINLKSDIKEVTENAEVSEAVENNIENLETEAERVIVEDDMAIEPDQNELEEIEEDFPIQEVENEIFSSSIEEVPLTDMANEELESLEIFEDEPKTTLGKIIQGQISTASKMDMKKFLLPYESLKASKIVIYFDEGQIFLGVFIFILAFFTVLFFQNAPIAIVLLLAGSLIAVTGYASEELHITNSRILMRRMDWVDRLFRIPRDSQYILDEIVAFDVQRAPQNKALLFSSILPILLLFLPSVRSNLFLIVLLVIVALILLILSQRLGKRSLSFLMSGGHQVHLGQYKGIPNSVIDEFTEIVMTKNIFQLNESY